MNDDRERKSMYSRGAVWKAKNGGRETLTILEKNQDGRFLVLTQISTAHITHWSEEVWQISDIAKWFSFDKDAVAQLPDRFILGEKNWGGDRLVGGGFTPIKSIYYPNDSEVKND